ncbi:hypothetical protein BLNAU_13673 [Blattamonas nauphoetae]|uniref:Uncharacterized protein n=1 Tax=Blattamonas nauphoetae TaxID=2049346 RepID=A0ABQ9XJ85_9EUKA|nr:hypothetical protein BLNAU_13673 [Blattamonas nauphoetae]
MFFLFALLSASSFRTPNQAGQPGESPSAVALEDQVPNEGKANLVLNYSAATEYAINTDLTLKFTEQATSNADPVEVTITTKSATAPSGTPCVGKFALTGIGAADSLQFGKSYKLTSYKYGASGTAATLSLGPFTVDEPDPLVTFSVTPKTVTSLTITATLEEKADAAKDVTVTFTPKTKDGKKVEKKFTIAKDATSVSVDFPLAAAEADNTLVYGEEYTLTAAAADKVRIAGSPITIEDYTKLTITPKLTPAEDGKKDGAKDHVSLTFVNGLLPAEVAKENPKQNLKLSTVEKTTSNEDFTLNKAEGIEWTHTKGQLVVKYIYDVAKMNKYPAGSDVKLKATLEVDALKWENVEFAYTEGAKSVASVVAALFAVLALVF